MSRFICPKCKRFASPTFWRVFWHIANEHAFEPNFVMRCGISGCEATYKKMESWRKHIYRNHKGIERPDIHTCQPHSSSLDSMGLNDDGMNISDNSTLTVDHEDSLGLAMTTSLPDVRRNSALFILKTRDGKRITQSCLDGILSDITTLNQQNLQYICSLALRSLKESGGTEAMLSAVQSSIMSDKAQLLFKGIETESLQNSLFRREFGLVEPLERVLGREYVQSGSRTTLKSNCCYDVPLFDSLQSLLGNVTVQQQVLTSHRSEGAILGDYCDGEDFSSHPLFSSDPHALQIVLYYDECEIANPLGSSLHKLGRNGSELKEPSITRRCV